MEKDISIIKLLESLKTNIDFKSIEVVDYWSADLCAIGLRSGNKLIYISTYAYLENEKSHYDFDLEIIDNDSSEKISVVKIGRDVTESELTNEINLFFSL